MRDITILSEDYIEVQKVILEAENFLKVQVQPELRTAEDTLSDLNDKGAFLMAKHSDIVSSVRDYDFPGMISGVTKMIDSSEDIPLKKVVILSKVTDPSTETPEYSCFSKEGCDMPVKKLVVTPNSIGKNIAYCKLGKILADATAAKRDLDIGFSTEDADKINESVQKLILIKSLESIL